jgi:hypothetical protein
MEFLGMRSKPETPLAAMFFSQRLAYGRSVHARKSLGRVCSAFAQIIVKELENDSNS